MRLHPLLILPRGMLTVPVLVLSGFLVTNSCTKAPPPESTAQPLAAPPPPPSQVPVSEPPRSQVANTAQTAPEPAAPRAILKRTGQNPAQQQAISEIQKLEGMFRIDEDSPGRLVIEVYLGFTRVTDASLVHLVGLTQLQRLDLFNTPVTDAGMEHVKRLSNLQSLNLNGTQITGAGLKHLRGLTRLQSLSLGRTQVTDKDLEHLKGFTNLQRLYLGSTQVTHAGVRDLQEALPKVEILR